MADITYDTIPHPLFPLSRGEVEDAVELLENFFGMEELNFGLRIVDDGRIANVNSAYLNCTGPTNVLSFPSTEDGKGDEQGNLGEIVLSVDTLNRETKLYGQIPEEHFVRLLTHALLHLMGYDHGPEMFSITDSAVESVTPDLRLRTRG
jgi:probable rRNA maturation factor